MTPAAQQLVLDHADLPRRVCRRTLRYVRLQCDRDDLASAATVGLCEAAERYNNPAVPFEAFALRRIAGAIKDWQRANHIIVMKRASRGVAMPTSFMDDVAKRRHFRTWDAEEGIEGLLLVPGQEAGQEDTAILNDLVGKSLQRLGRRERLLLVGALIDQEQQETARAVGVTPSRVAQLMHSVRATVAQVAAC